MEEVLGKLYKYGGLAVRKAEHTAYEAQMPKHNVDFVAPSALIGIEIEVENISSCPPCDYYWKAKQDGSLRNNGIEFTSIPLRAQQVPYALDYIERALADRGNKPDFSPRTSIHVHLNARDMTWDQVKLLVLLYAVFERHFFHMAGTKREQSIFCVPLYASNQMLNWHRLSDFVTRWHKYNALNLGTLIGGQDMPSYGTIEFRHLYGTLDRRVLIPWINSILCLRQASNDYKLEDMVERIKFMNTTSEYFKLYTEIFGELALTDKMIKHDFEHCITMTKQCLFGPNLHKVEGNVDSKWGKFLRGIKDTKSSAQPNKSNFDDFADVITAVPMPPTPDLGAVQVAAAYKKHMQKIQTAQQVTLVGNNTYWVPTNT